MLELVIGVVIVLLIFIPTAFVRQKRRQLASEVVLLDGTISGFEPKGQYLDFVAGTIFVRTAHGEELDEACILPWPEPPEKGTPVRFEESALGMLRSEEWLSDPTEFASLLAARLNTEAVTTEYFIEVATTGLTIRVFDDGWLGIEIPITGPDWLEEDEELDIGTYVEGIHEDVFVEQGVRYMRWSLDHERPLESLDMLPSAFRHAVSALTDVKFVEFCVTRETLEIDIELVFMDVDLALAIAGEFQAATDFLDSSSADDSPDAIW